MDIFLSFIGTLSIVFLVPIFIYGTIRDCQDEPFGKTRRKEQADQLLEQTK